MIFNKIHEARDWFLNYKKIENNKSLFFWTEYDFKDWKFGDYILFQHIKDDNLVSRPIFAIFISFTVWDQALVINYIQPKRAWMYWHEVITNPDPKSYYSMPIGHMDDEIENIQFWTDNIHVMNHWKSRPSITQLRESYSNILVNVVEQRDNLLNNIIS
jgi:hypothetical protein